MTYKFIHRLFELDLLIGLPEIVEENQWFRDDFFAVYSFPMELDITPEIDRKLGMISHDNSESYETYLEGDLYLGSKWMKAILEIEDIEDLKMTAKIVAGLEGFPNFNKKLSELPLHKEDVNGSFYAFAETIIDQGWPVVNYNFPQIIAPETSFDTSTDQFEFFQGFLNHYKNGAFIENEFDDVNIVQYNRNIMQPMPYLMHVLVTGFQDAGFELRGDIMNDALLKKIILETESNYYKTVSAQTTEFTLLTDEYQNLINQNSSQDIDIEYQGQSVIGEFEKEIVITEPGFYTIQGNSILRTWHSLSALKIKINGETVFSVTRIRYYQGYREHYKSVDFNFSIPPGETATIYVGSVNLRLSKIDETYNLQDTILDVTITQVSKYDSNGNLQPTLVDPQTVDLTKTVPEITFGDLVKFVKGIRNYELIPKENGTVEMNRITPKITVASSQDLRSTEKISKYRGFQQGKTFLLKYQDVESDIYKFNEVFVSREGFQTEGYLKKDDTSEIALNGIPLPIKTHKGVTTADAFIEGNDKVKMVVYDHNSPGNNTSSPASLDMLNIYDLDYSDWLNFRIFAKVYKWKFIKPIDEAILLDVYKKSSAYGRDHIIKKSIKKTISKDYMEIEIETES